MRKIYHFKKETMNTLVTIILAIITSFNYNYNFKFPEHVVEQERTITQEAQPALKQVLVKVEDNNQINTIKVAKPTPIDRCQVRSNNQADNNLIIGQINQYRESNGLNQLEQAGYLNKSAGWKAQLIIDTGYDQEKYWQSIHGDNAHYPNKMSLYSQYDGKCGFLWGNPNDVTGENLARNIEDTKVVSAWQNSPAHNDNLLMQNVTKIGISKICNTDCITVMLID